jgi:hypothetical protein
VETSLDAFVAAHAGRSLDEFCERVRDPHLLVLSRPAQESAGAPDFVTLRLRAARPGHDRASLLPLRKRPGSNPFMMMITLGRAANNDIVLATPDVSKLHCYFHRFAGGWSLCDPGSTNGTHLDGRRVNERGLPVRSGARIWVADAYELLFLLPEDLHELVRGRRPAEDLAGRTVAG